MLSKGKKDGSEVRKGVRSIPYGGWGGSPARSQGAAGRSRSVVLRPVDPRWRAWISLENLGSWLGLCAREGQRCETQVLCVAAP